MPWPRGQCAHRPPQHPAQPLLAEPPELSLAYPASEQGPYPSLSGPYASQPHLPSALLPNERPLWALPAHLSYAEGRHGVWGSLDLKATNATSSGHSPLQATASPQQRPWSHTLLSTCHRPEPDTKPPASHHPTFQMPPPPALGFSWLRSGIQPTLESSHFRSAGSPRPLEQLGPGAGKMANSRAAGTLGRTQQSAGRE